MDQIEERSSVDEPWTGTDNDLVFTNGLGDLANPMRQTRISADMANRDWPGARLPDPRHFHASMLFAQGESPVLVRQPPGHGSIATTANIHGHLMPAVQHRAALAFAQAMEG